MAKPVEGQGSLFAVRPAPSTPPSAVPPDVLFARVRAETRAMHGPTLIALACRTDLADPEVYERIAYFWARDAGRLGNRALDMEGQT